MGVEVEMGSDGQARLQGFKYLANFNLCCMILHQNSKVRIHEISAHFNDTLPDFLLLERRDYGRAYRCDVGASLGQMARLYWAHRLVDHNICSLSKVDKALERYSVAYTQTNRLMCCFGASICLGSKWQAFWSWYTKTQE